MTFGKVPARQSLAANGRKERFPDARMVRAARTRAVLNRAPPQLQNDQDVQRLSD